MNNKGQVLVLFVLFLPIIIMIIGIVTDTGMMLLEVSKLDNFNKYLATYSSKTPCDAICIQEIIDKNDQEVTFTLDATGTLSTIALEKNINSIFGKIINIDHYPIKSKYAYGIENNQVVVKKLSTKEG